MGGFTQDVVEGAWVSQGWGCCDYAGEWTVTWCPSGHFHSGIDLAAPLGTTVRTTRTGVVTVVGINYLGPYAVGIKTDEGPYLVFGHLDSAAVSVGQRVNTGQPIGRCGTRGNSSGPHVHFAARTDAATENVWPTRVDTRILDPTPYLTNQQGEDVTQSEKAAWVLLATAAGKGRPAVQADYDAFLPLFHDNGDNVQDVVNKILWEQEGQNWEGHLHGIGGTGPAGPQGPKGDKGDPGGLAPGSTFTATIK